MITNNDIKNIIKFLKNKNDEEVKKYINNPLQINDLKLRNSFNKLKLSSDPIKKFNKIKSIYLNSSTKYNFNLNDSQVPYQPDRTQREYPGYDYLEKYYEHNEKNLMKGGFFAALNDAVNEDEEGKSNESQEQMPPQQMPPQQMYPQQMPPQQMYSQQMYPQNPYYQTAYQKYSYQRPLQQGNAPTTVPANTLATAPATAPAFVQPQAIQQVASPGPIVQSVPPHSHPRVPIEEHTHLPAETKKSGKKDSKTTKVLDEEEANDLISKQPDIDDETLAENLDRSDFAKDFNKLTHKISYNSELPYNKIGNDDDLQKRYMDLENHIEKRADEIQRITDEKLTNPYQINVMEEIKFKLINEMRNQISSKIDQYIAQNLVNQMPVQRVLPQPSVYQNTVPPFFTPNIILP